VRNTDKGKVTFVPFHATGIQRGGRSILRSFLTSAIDGDERSASLPGRFNPGKKHRPIEWVVRRVPESVLMIWRRKKHFLLWSLELRIVQTVS
jgi:hypothetical protein